tara:strand:+ start:470 stop:730 length:261 start_codon:yes stop_codon:yes gene_type:complete
MKKIHKTITLDLETSKLAAKKTNFSQWVRNMLRSERNKTESHIANQHKTRIEESTGLSTFELLHHLESKSPEEISALIAILRMSQS